ncbi:MAG: hypothetical protein HYV42_01985 [Candidatus Magasanikbacteria bacterium]|nr:hypothetical protein [Candidatus Magasanikbacteria bacterium]
MTTATITKKLTDLEQRLGLIEQYVIGWPGSNQPKNSARRALQAVQGLWVRRPRTNKQLRAARARLWRS